MDLIDDPLFSDDEVFAYFIDGFDMDPDEGPSPDEWPPGPVERQNFLQRIAIQVERPNQYTPSPDDPA